MNLQRWKSNLRAIGMMVKGRMMPQVVNSPEQTEPREIALLAAFPEGRFDASDDLREVYNERVISGYANMASQRVVIAALARNVAHIMPATMARIERLGGMFADYRVVIYENDSDDDTSQQIERWSRANPKVVLISETLGDPVNPPSRCVERVARMAKYRANCHAMIRQRFSDWDKVVVLDSDLLSGWSYDGIANTFGHAGWDFVGSNGIIYKRFGTQPNVEIQYDAWAYRDTPDYLPLSTKEVNFMHWDRGESMVPLYCCFGGLGVYRMEAFLAGRYCGGDVEHVGLHRSMREQGYGNQFLNPSQITLYGRKNRKMDRPMRTICTALTASRLLPKTNWYGACA